MTMETQSATAGDEARRLLAMVRLDPELWFRHCAVIVDAAGRRVRGPRPSATQQRMFDHYRRCRAARVPCKMLVYKPRRDGASTGAQALVYHHLQANPGLRGKLMANTDQTVREVADIFHLLADEDAFDWAGPMTRKLVRNEDERELTGGSVLRILTSRGEEPGRGGGAQVANMTEVAHFPEHGDPTKAFLSSVEAALTDPVGLIIADSTPNGPQGWFYRQVCAAVAREREGRQTLDDWHLIFTPWWERINGEKPFRAPAERETFMAGLREDERSEMERFGTAPDGTVRITPERLHWRRAVIDQFHEGDVRKFRQEYPSDVMEGFLLSVRTRFSLDGLEALERGAFAPQRVTVVTDRGRAAFTPDPAGLWEVWEEPRFGLRYLLVVDTMTGEDQVGGDDPDWHAALVMRAEFTDEQGRTFLPRVVAAHRSRIEIGVLAGVVEAGARLYGSPGSCCLVVPEVNNSGLALVTLLSARGVPVYERRQINRSTSEETRHLGWKTDAMTRKTIVDGLALRVLKRTLDIPSREILAEMRTFVVDSGGTPRAMSGHHDDWVMALAIGQHNLGLAGERTVPKRRLAAVDGFRRAAGNTTVCGW